MTIFKQYGEQRSGTNYLKRLLELNFCEVEVFGSVLGWKHGLYQLANGAGSPSAVSHLDWIERNRKGDAILSVDGYPLPYSIEFLQEAASRLNYLISYKRLLPWLVSLKRFRFPKRPFERPQVEQLFRTYLSNYRTWLQLPGRLVVDHDWLIDHEQRPILLNQIQARYGLTWRKPEMIHERRVVKASTDHGLLFAEQAFEPEYYTGHRYLQELPSWVVELSQAPELSTDFIECAIWPNVVNTDV